MENRIDRAAELLRVRFPDAAVTAERIMGGMQTPCLQLLPESASLKHEMGSRFRLEENYRLNWYPGDEKEILSGMETLLLAVKEIWPRAEVKAERDGDRLCLDIGTEEICFLTGEEAEKMKRELLTLQLKWQEEARKG